MVNNIFLFMYGFYCELHNNNNNNNNWTFRVIENLTKRKNENHDDSVQLLLYKLVGWIITNNKWNA